MKVSILVPVYGVERFIERCAVSLMEQTHDDVEYIFVDDCTPDASIAILREVVSRYPQRAAQVRIIAHERNMGLAAARATALDAATGEAIMIVDSDDYVTPTAVERLVQAMTATGADVVDGAYAIEKDSVRVNTTAPFAGSTRRYLRTMLCHDLVDNNVWARLIRRDLFAGHNIRWTAGVNNGEDYSVIPRLLLHARRAVVDEVVYIYRNDNAASYTSHMTPEKFTQWLRANRIVADYLAAHDAAGEYTTALQLGIIGEVSRARTLGLDPAMVDELCPIEPQSWWLKALKLQSFIEIIPVGMARFIFKCVRRVYCTFC